MSVYSFRRFVRGQEMAEDVRIETAEDLEHAIKKAVALCPEPRTTLVYVGSYASELLEWRDRAETAEHRMSESLSRGDRQEALIVELRDGLTRLSDKIREAKYD
jgi:transposase